MIPKSNAPSILFALFPLLLTSAAAQITTHVWTGGTVSLGNRNWTSTGNWVGGVPPKSFQNTEVVLQGFWNREDFPVVNEPWSIRTLRLGLVGAGSAYLYGEDLTIGAGGILFDEGSSRSIRVENKILVRRDQAWSKGTSQDTVHDLEALGDIEFLAPTIVTTPYKVTVGEDIWVYVYENIIGEGTIEVANGGYVRFYSPNTDTNLTSSASGTSFLVQTGGVLSMSARKTTVTTDRITLNEGGEIRLFDAVNSLRVNSLQGGGTVRFYAAESSGIASQLIHQGNVNESFGGNFLADASEDRMDFIKTGTATLTMNRGGLVSGNSFRNLEIRNGKLRLSSNSTMRSRGLSGSGLFEIDSGSAYEFNGGDSSAQTVFSGSGRVNIFSGASLELTAPGASHRLGRIDVTGGLTLQNTSSLEVDTLGAAGTLTLGSGAEIRIASSGFSSFPGTITHTGTPSSPNGLLTVTNPINFALTGTAKQHSFDTLAIAEGATLSVRNQSELLVRRFIGSASTLQLLDDSTAYLVQNPSAAFQYTLDAANGNVVIPIGERFQLTAPGKTHSIGDLDIGNRGLDLGGSSSLTLGSLSGSVALSIDSGSTLNLPDFQNSPFTGAFTNGSGGGGVLNLTSGGTKVLRAGAFTGTTHLRLTPGLVFGGTHGTTYQTLPNTAPAGPLTIHPGVKLESPNINNSSLNLNGVLELTSIPSPGGPVHGGGLTGTLTLGNGSRTILTINDRPTRPSGFGKIVASGGISMDTNAIIEVNLNNTFNAQSGDVWRLLEATGGSFPQANAPIHRIVNATNLPAGTELVWVKTATTLELQLQSIVTDPPGYFTWASSNGLTPANRGPFLDADNDGRLNWREYLLGLNPLSADQPPVAPVEMRMVAGQPVFRFRCSPQVDYQNEFEVQGSEDLGATDPWQTSKATILATGNLNDGYSYLDYRFHLSTDDSEKGFLRLRYKGLTTHPDD